MNRTRLALIKPQISTEPLHIKYRPKSLEEVLGQESIVRSLGHLAAKADCPHAFLFSGPSGVGKTTLGRIMARNLGCAPHNIVEVDAATFSGVDNIRSLTSTLPYAAFGEEPNKMVILDEAHALSKSAFQALLKTVEEPPLHVYFAFCTTDPNKMPRTIVTRCAHFDLKPLKPSTITDLIDRVCEREGIKLSGEFINEIIKYADGSARAALMALAKAEASQTVADLRELLDSILDEDAVLGLCRAVTSPAPKWAEMKKWADKLQDQNWGEISIAIVRYITKCVLSANNDKDVTRFIRLLEIFSEPGVTPESGLVLAIGRAVFADR